MVPARTLIGKLAAVALGTCCWACKNSLVSPTLLLKVKSLELEPWLGFKSLFFQKKQKLSLVFLINLSSQSKQTNKFTNFSNFDNHLTKPVQYLNLRDLTFREAWYSPVHCSAVLPSSSNSSLVFPIKLLRNFPLERCLLVPKSGASNKSFTPSDACLA